MGTCAAISLGAATQQPPTPSSPATKGVPRTLIDRRLQEHAVQLMALDGDTVTYTEPSGLVRKESTSEFVALLPQGQDAGTAGATALRPLSEIELVDGQRFPGSLGAIPAGAAPADTISWDYQPLGALELKLDQVRALQLRPDPMGQAPRPPEPNDSDIALLTNGDRAAGLLEGFLAQGPALRLSVGGQSRDIPLERVQEVRLLSNPGAKPPADATILWLHDGAIASVRALRTSRTGEVSLELAPGTPASGTTPGATPAAPAPATSTLAASGNVSLGEILGAEFHPGTLVPLASLTPAEQKPAPGRRWTRPVAVLSEGALLHLSDLELPGPMTAEWDIPAGATRFATEAELPRSSWDWGDAELSVTLIAGGHETELFRRRLTADQPHAAINASLSSSTPSSGTGVPPVSTPSSSRLRVRLEAGAYGPVQDRVILRRPMLLVGER